MKFINYFIRFYLAFTFIRPGFGKLFGKYDAEAFKAKQSMMSPEYLAYYDLLMQSGFMNFVGASQIVIAILLVFKRTYLLGAVMLVPLILQLVMVHVFLSGYTNKILFDSLLLVLALVLIFQNFEALKNVFLKPQDNLI